jgi:hypothetical protein
LAESGAGLGVGEHFLNDFPRSKVGVAKLPPVDEIRFFGKQARIWVRDSSDTVSRVGESPYGLQAGVFMHDARFIQQAFERLEGGGS